MMTILIWEKVMGGDQEEGKGGSGKQEGAIVVELGIREEHSKSQQIQYVSELSFLHSSIR